VPGEAISPEVQSLSIGYPEPSFARLSMSHVVDVRGVKVPGLIYGTAWKEERTAELTRLALAAGFTGIDTANQRKHYFEAGVGEALAASRIDRDRIFLQTKFTYARGQDHRLPFDPRAELAAQVRQSFASSLDHLGVEVLDAYLLHGPESWHHWSDGDREVWRAMEEFHREGRTRAIGVSNVSYPQLATLCAEAAIQPAIVQNRCFARYGWDRDVRQLCQEHGIAYQGFSLLTANQRELAVPAVAAIAERTGGTVAQVVFRFAQAIGIVALTGTSSEVHMRQDLAADGLMLDDADVELLENLAG
jgi:diketogulonate reductase-like aldo/keto reductase